ncbi:CopD family protein [Sediminicoccus rosea]|jgi:putative copper resistance protein D|uniref:CopD family protein n=1 Tax=Sediminicoccus rosea TaxID=1225128 RepID=A0ABZ0PPW6_9PROT|nr:CopD family protein [Sediminicoccus rosea]WPB87323.1 CopD family protein [Sediminicoccus rosea]
MILEFLQPDPSLLDGATVLLRAAQYATSLGAAGIGLFLAGFGHRLDPGGLAHLRRWLLGAALAGIAVSLLGLLLRAQILSGNEAWFDGAVWRAMMVSRIGDAFWLRVVGLALLALAAMPWPVAPALAAMGALIAAASYAAMGHSTLYRPRQELSALVTLHLLAVGFWIGSLPLLIRAAMAGEAGLIAAWSRAAIAMVAVVVLAGGIAAILLVPRWDLLFAAWYGWGMIAKLLLVLGLIALAAWHRLRLAPALAEGGRPARQRLARSIRIEAVLALLVFWAAAEMVSVHPLDAGHRIAP